MKVFGVNPIHCYFIKVTPRHHLALTDSPDYLQVYGPSQPEEAFLQPPPLEKQFLISPPCSPPVGWEQPREGQPVVDYDLLAAIAELAPGEDHELQASTRDTPSIVVQLCQGQEELRNKQRPAGRITQVRLGTASLSLVERFMILLTPALSFP